MQPPQSADLPKARYTLPGVINVLWSEARIQSMALWMSLSLMLWQWQTIMGYPSSGMALTAKISPFRRRTSAATGVEAAQSRGDVRRAGGGISDPQRLLM